jgi:hypothetical protein
VIRISGVAKDPLVLLVEGIHRVPGERHAVAEELGEPREVRVLPRSPWSLTVAEAHGVPSPGRKVAMVRLPPTPMQDLGKDVVLREAGDRVTTRLVEQNDLVALRDPRSAKAHAHSAPEWFGEEQSLGEGSGP